MVKRTNYLRCEFESFSRNEALARALVSSFAIQLDPTVSELTDLKCAVSEAVTNSIVHGYRDCVGKIIMTMCSYDDRRIKIEIRDKGVGIENIEKAMEPLYTTDAENERSGMGFTVMESFTDKLRVRSAPGRGTKITLIKKLTPM
ncbi:MAG: anti-sigma F factor [Clostridia bacterium]|nr:anti-sigma F factor [Clostridia bacterium]